MYVIACTTDDGRLGIYSGMSPHPDVTAASSSLLWESDLSMYKKRSFFDNFQKAKNFRVLFSVNDMVVQNGKHEEVWRYSYTDSELLLKYCQVL